MASLDPSDRSAESTTDRTCLVGRTTIELHRRTDGRWVATQDDVAVEGRGGTAAEAAATYCRRVAEEGG